MRRKYVLVCISLLTASGAAAFAMMPQTGGVLRSNLPFVPEVFGLLGAGDKPGASTVTPTAESTPRPRRDPFSPIDLPLGTGRIFLAEAGKDKPEQPAGQQEAQAQPNKTGSGSDTTGEETSENNNNASGFDLADGGFSTIAIPTSLTPRRPVPNVPPPGAPQNNPSNPAPNSPKPPETQAAPGQNGPGVKEDGDNEGNGPSDRTVQVDEPGPLSLLLLGGLALALTRRAKRPATAEPTA